MAQVTVTPSPGGWTLDCPAAGEPLMFLSGRQAELKARSMARCLAELGEEVQVVVHDRSGRLAGTLGYRRGVG